MEKLVEGFGRFREKAFPVYEDLFRTLAHAQSPHTLFIALCLSAARIAASYHRRHPRSPSVRRRKKRRMISQNIEELMRATPQARKESPARRGPPARSWAEHEFPLMEERS